MKDLSARRKRVTKAVSIDTAVVEWAEGRAREENRSLSNFVENLLLQRKDEQEAKKDQPELELAH